MRERKQSDSPSGYNRDVYPNRAKRHANREWPAGPLGDAMHAIFVRLQAIQFEEAKAGRTLLSQDPRELAGVLERLGKAGQLEGLASAFETAGAYALAGLVSACRAEELRPDLGDAA